MIQLKDIQFAYSKKGTLFSKLNLELQSGHICGLFGKNGAGKTTLLKIMTGLLFAQKGEAWLFGQGAEKRLPEILSKIFFISEEPAFPQLKIKDFAKTYSVFYPQFKEEEYFRYLQKFEITNINACLDRLSFGQKKKVLIAFGLAVNTPLLIMDEPTNGLDIPSKSIFRSIMASASSKERLILISTHQVRDLHSLIDTVIVLDSGEIIFNETTDRIVQKLYFDIEEQMTESEKVLYREENIQGNRVIRENTEGMETNLDMELLFNAIVSNRTQIQSLFNL
jgi:ABC-2 type transport system ATP-binding protein